MNALIMQNSLTWTSKNLKQAHISMGKYSRKKKKKGDGENSVINTQHVHIFFDTLIFLQHTHKHTHTQFLKQASPGQHLHTCLV